jgi:hypothetical protein
VFYLIPFKRRPFVEGLLALIGALRRPQMSVGGCAAPSMYVDNMLKKHHKAIPRQTYS